MSVERFVSPRIRPTGPLHVVAWAMLAIAALTTPATVSAQSYPTKAVKLVVPFPPGGPLDISGRLIAQKLTEIWGQPVVVENKPGAGGYVERRDRQVESPRD